MGKDKVKLVIRSLMYECDHVINVVSKASGGVPLGSRTIEKGNFEITLIAVTYQFCYWVGYILKGELRKLLETVEGQTE